MTDAYLFRESELREENLYIIMFVLFIKYFTNEEVQFKIEKLTFQW